MARRSRLAPAEETIILWAIEPIVQLLHKRDLTERKPLILRRRIHGETLHAGQSAMPENQLQKRGWKGTLMRGVQPEGMGSHQDVGWIGRLDHQNSTWLERSNGLL